MPVSQGAIAYAIDLRIVARMAVGLDNIAVGTRGSGQAVGAGKRSPDTDILGYGRVDQATLQEQPR